MPLPVSQQKHHRACNDVCRLAIAVAKGSDHFAGHDRCVCPRRCDGVDADGQRVKGIVEGAEEAKGCVFGDRSVVLVRGYYSRQKDGSVL